MSNLVLASLQAASILACAWGMFNIYGLSNSSLALFYNGLWFILGSLGSLCGLISIVFSYIEDEDTADKSHTFLQYHYLLAWFTVILGYPALVSSFWMVYYPSYFAHVHAIIALIPLVAWFFRQNRVIVVTTQVVSALAIISHAYITYLANNTFGLIGAATMVFNVVSLSMPTRYNLIGLSSRESFILGLLASTYFLSVAVESMVKNPTPVKNIFPW